MSDADGNRPLTDDERRLARWMLENGELGAASFLPQLEKAKVTPWRCKCGCASIEFKVDDLPPAPPGVHPIGDYTFDNVDGDVSGIFIYESHGTLSGIEVFSMAGDVPKALPQPEALRKWRPGVTSSE